MDCQLKSQQMNDLTDHEILAIYRQRLPYVTLSTAKALYRLERRYRHLGRSAREATTGDIGNAGTDQSLMP